jgi:hypothetical protein
MRDIGEKLMSCSNPRGFPRDPVSPPPHSGFGPTRVPKGSPLPKGPPFWLFASLNAFSKVDFQRLGGEKCIEDGCGILYIFFIYNIECFYLQYRMFLFTI